MQWRRGARFARVTRGWGRPLRGLLPIKWWFYTGVCTLRLCREERDGTTPRKSIREESWFRNARLTLRFVKSSSNRYPLRSTMLQNGKELLIWPTVRFTWDGRGLSGRITCWCAAPEVNQQDAAHLNESLVHLNGLTDKVTQLCLLFLIVVFNTPKA